jgi:hypothetical protein
MSHTKFIGCKRFARSVVCCLLAGCCFCALATEDDSAYQDALRLLSEGRIEEARAAFQAVVAQREEHAGAWLDLAIVQCGMGMSEEAEASFRHTLERFDPPPAIRELIRQIRARGCQRQMPERLASHRFEFSRGHDSNVNQGATNPFSLGGLPLSPEFFPNSDNFTQLSLESTTLFTRHNLMLHGRFQTRRHDHLTHYDLTSGIVAAEQTWRPGSWENRLGVTLGAAQLGGHLYQRQFGVYAQVSPPWPVLPTGWRYGFVGDLSRMRYPTLANFDASIVKYQFVLNFQNGKSRLTGSVGALRDFGESARPGGDKEGWAASLAWRRRLGGGFTGELSWARQDWRGKKVYFPGLIDTNLRRDQRTTLRRVALIRSLNAQHSLTLEFRDLDNRENIGLFSYRGKQFLLTWQYAR